MYSERVRGRGRGDASIHDKILIYNECVMVCDEQDSGIERVCSR